MDFDNSWQALLDPGAATRYFDVHGQTRFEAEASHFSPLNAWWLAELSRLVYRRGVGDTRPPHKGRSRSEILADVGLQETPIMTERAQAILIKPLSATAPQFKLLVFRGTDDLMDSLTDIDVMLDKWAGAGLVHQGINQAFETIWRQIEPQLTGDSPLFYTGHSLGAALATLTAALKPPRALYTYGSPLTGNSDFTASLSGVPVFRVVNNRDVVTTVPPPLGYRHVGELHYVTHDGRIIVNPDNTTVALDRLKSDTTALLSREWHRHFTDAPEFLADHTPQNYVAHLERAF